MKNKPSRLHEVTVTPEWLAERLRREEVVAVDVSWYQAHENRNPSEEFLAEHVPGAIYIPLEALSASSSSLPHTLPDIESLCATLGRYGIDNETTVVSYDATGFRTSPRLWWLLKWAGHPRAAILDGGLPAWKAAGFAVESGVTRRSAATFAARSGGHMPTATADDVVGALGDSGVQVVDARPRERFDGTSPEPRPGLRSGHIPGSVSAELKCFVDPVTNRLLPPGRHHPADRGAGHRPRPQARYDVRLGRGRNRTDRDSADARCNCYVVRWVLVRVGKPRRSSR